MKTRSSLITLENPAKEHIEEIRRKKFFIGAKESNPLTEDLHHAVKSLSAGLYTKDIHFLMELIQNSEDNEYQFGVDPTLEFVLTYEDITGTGAPATLLVFNNEIGFSRKNMDSICSVGRSTKRGKRNQGFIGEKGIGFKSVFLVSACPLIFSNGYQVMFREEPDEECGIGYIVPKWVDAKPTISEIQSVYDCSKPLPTTAIVLPLRGDKVDAVKQQLCEVHPELLLFLSKIKKLSVSESNGSSHAGNPISAVAISSEVSLVTVKDIQADSCIVHLSVQEPGNENQTMCRYYIFRQTFPVKADNKVPARQDIEEWPVSLAFPFGERLKRGTSSAGIFAFLPTEMVTNFPFIIQADFILASSRETILLDNKWNLGILDCVPMAFLNAFFSCLKSRDAFHLSSVAQVFEFFPVEASSFHELNHVRNCIKGLVQPKNVIPCELLTNEEIVFRLPVEVIRLLPDFRKFLYYVKKQGVALEGVYSFRKFILHSSLDAKAYDKVLDFLGVKSVETGYWWYAKFIQSCNLVATSENVYIELLNFLAYNWSVLDRSTFEKIFLIKHINEEGKVRCCNILEIRNTTRKIYYAVDSNHHAWLQKCNTVFGCLNNKYFLPRSTQLALVRHKNSFKLMCWLKFSTGVVCTTVYDYSYQSLNPFARNKLDPKLSISLAHFLYHSYRKRFITESDAFSICSSMPIVDNSGIVNVQNSQSLVPSSGSKWSKLFGPSNPFKNERCVELGKVYAKSGQFADEHTRTEVLLSFLTKYTRAADLPDMLPPNVTLLVALCPLTSEQAFILLGWIQHLQRKGHMPTIFIDSIRNGKWMKTVSGFNSPSRCFLYDGSDRSIFANLGSILDGFSVIDQRYYDNKIGLYEDELKCVGVKLGCGDLSGLIVDRLKCLTSSAVSSKCAISFLQFIRYSKAADKLDEGLLETLKREKWVKTSAGYVAPSDSVLLLKEKEGILQITSIPCVDETFYGNEILCFSNELKLLGVIVEVEKAYKIIMENFKFPADLSSVTRQSLLLILKCIRYVGSEAVGFTTKIKDQSCLKTTCGIKCPTESLLPGQDWGFLLDGHLAPLVDEDYYGNDIRSFLPELKEIGVTTDLHSVFKMMCSQVKSLLLSGSLTNSVVLSLLVSIRFVGEAQPNIILPLRNFLSNEKWLKTCHGYRSAADSVLFDLKWGTVSQFVDLPLIDDAFYGIGIYSFKDELKMLGVVVDFSEGSHFVARGLNFPKESTLVTAEGALSILQCLRFMINNSVDQSMFNDFLEKLRVNTWLKTYSGYKSSSECFLYDPDWDGTLNPKDAPFIDGDYYGSSFYLYKGELKEIGVKVDAEHICSVIVSYLGSSTNTSSINGIYTFLHKFKWRGESPDKFNSQVWLPNQNGTDGGDWVNSQICVLHDKDNLFGSRFHVLDNYYSEGLLSFFSFAFSIAETPSIVDYMNLWNNWESDSTHKVSPADCCSFWKYILESWNPRTEDLLKKNITKLPASNMLENTIQLVEIEEVLIPDNRQLEKVFTGATKKPLFVWSPQKKSTSVRKLYGVYSRLGVRKVSESVEFDANSVLSGDAIYEVTDLRIGLIEKGLIKIVLAFLAESQVNMPLQARHAAVRPLCNLSGLQTNEPIMVNCSLSFPLSNRRLDVKTRQLVHWEKKSGYIVICKSGWQDHKPSLKFVASFANALSSGLLQGKTKIITRLAKMIEKGMAFGFHEDDVDFLLMRENLELLNEDKEFLDAAFSPEQYSSPSRSKRKSLEMGDSAESAFIGCKKKM